MQSIWRWIKRHPFLSVLVAFLALISGASMFSEDGSIGGSLFAFAFFSAIVWVIGWLIDRSKSGETAKHSMTAPLTQTFSSPPSREISPPLRRQSTTPSARQRTDPTRVNQSFLAGLDNTTRIGVTNMLAVDEEIIFTLLGKNGTLVGTDRALFLIPPGRKGFEQRTAASYVEISNIRIDPTRQGGYLRFDSGGSTHQLELINQDQLDRGLIATHEIRKLAHEAQTTREEDSAPSDDSAFVETAHQPIPSIPVGVSVMSLGDMLAMTPTEFEHLTGRALEAMGYQDMKVSGGAGDLAADLTGRDPQGRSVIVQCKRYAPGNKVGSPAIQQFIGMKAIHHKADRGIYVTTADYSQQAINLANEHGIVLIDGDDLVKITALLLAKGETSTHTQTTPTTRFCTNCGARNEPDAKFCAECGTAMA